MSGVYNMMKESNFMDGRKSQNASAHIVVNEGYRPQSQIITVNLLYIILGPLEKRDCVGVSYIVYIIFMK